MIYPFAAILQKSSQVLKMMPESKFIVKHSRGVPPWGVSLVLRRAGGTARLFNTPSAAAAVPDLKQAFSHSWALARRGVCRGAKSKSIGNIIFDAMGLQPDPCQCTDGFAVIRDRTDFLSAAEVVW